MIGAENTVINERLFDPVFFDNIPGHKEVIDAPPDIAISGFKAVGPPRVLFCIRVKMSEGVHILFEHYYDLDADKALPISELTTRFEQSGRASSARFSRTRRCSH